jgi:hypothetical protein
MNAQVRKQTGNPRNGKKKRRSSSGWLHWWPFLVGIAVIPLAVKTAEILPLTGADGLMKLRLLYPFAMLVREHGLGLTDADRENVSHILLYAQFPLYGLYAMVAMRWKSWAAALTQVAVIHLVGFGLLWLLA